VRFARQLRQGRLGVMALTLYFYNTLLSVTVGDWCRRRPHFSLVMNQWKRSNQYGLRTCCAVGTARTCRARGACCSCLCASLQTDSTLKLHSLQARRPAVLGGVATAPVCTMPDHALCSALQPQW
jgi:hypothetical protein